MIRTILTCFAATVALAAGQQIGPGTTVRPLMEAGRWTEAEPLARQALADAEKDSGPNSEAVADVLEMVVEISVYSSRMNDPQDRAMADRLLTLTKQLYGAKSAKMARNLRMAAEVALRDEDYAQTRVMLTRAIAIHESLEDPDDVVEHAEAWNDLAILLKETDDFEGAKVDYERALGLYQQALGPEHRLVAVCLNNLAVVLARVGDVPGAKARFIRALEIYERTVGPKHALVAGCLNNYGVLLTDHGEPEQAIELLKRSVDIAEAAYGKQHRRTATAVRNLAEAYTAAGQYDAAVPLFARALQTYQTIMGKNHSIVASTLGGIAASQGLAGKTQPAVENAVRAEDMARAYLRIAIRTLPEREALLIATAWAGGQRLAGMDTLVNLAVAKGPSAPALDEAIRSRAVVFDEMAARQRVVRTGDPEIARLSAELDEARQNVSHLVVRGPESMPAAEYEAKLQRALEAKYEAERLLAQKSLRFRQEAQERVAGLREVQAALDKDSALVSFVRYPHRDFQIDAPARKPSTPAVVSYMAFVLRPGKTQPTAIYLGAAQEIDALVGDLRQKIAQEALDPGLAPKRSEEAFRRSGRRLRERIWDPLAPAVGDARRVFVVPDGTLHLVNLTSLPVAEGGYLIEKGPLIHYLSTERDLVEQPRAANGKGLLVVGNPAFNARPAGVAMARTFRGGPAVCGEFESLRFDPLPDTALEAREVAAIWQSAGAGPVIRLAGAEARESAFREQAAGKRVLHVATHGFFLGGCKSASTGANMRENPLLLSGLALAGANQRHDIGPEDDQGILTAEDIAAMDLDGVEWAVLSACNTALGELRAGEGIFGLRRAFQAAGVRTVIAGLWPVEDRTTRQWMQVLYRSRFEHGMTTAEAMREASLSLLNARRAAHLSTHPLYWGGFVAVGDWR